MAIAKQIRIVTDTTALMPPGFATAHQIIVVPQIIEFGQESFLENVTLTYDEFVRRLKLSAQLPKTAAPLVGDLIEAYREQHVTAQTILSIHPSVDVSGTVRSAALAKAEAFPDADIRILDTRAVAGTLGAMVVQAAEWVDHGVDADEIMRRLTKMIPRARTYFLIATLEYLHKGGRIGGASALVGSALQIKPILEFRNGRVEVAEKIRTYRHAFERLKELVIEQCPHSPAAHLCVMHADNLDAARLLHDELQAKLGIHDIPIYPVGAAITTHAGPGVVGVGFFG
jgi:DegV family protein with EDD domain